MKKKTQATIKYLVGVGASCSDYTCRTLQLQVEWRVRPDSKSLRRSI